MIRTISIAARSTALGLALAGCAGSTVKVPASNALVCAALRQALPVRYHKSTVDDESRANIMRGNAAFAEACPDPPAP